MLKQTIETDLKSAMLGGNKATVNALKNIKSAIQYAEVELRTKGSSDINDEQIIAVIAKESKKRQEAADLYSGAGQAERAKTELDEKAIIDKYLPAQASADEVKKVVSELILKIGSSQSAKGQIIGEARKHFGSAADGALIAKIVSEGLDISK